jgi:hypothetical protein
MTLAKRAPVPSAIRQGGPRLESVVECTAAGIILTVMTGRP